MISYFLIRGFDTPRNIYSPFSPHYNQARLSVELYLVTVAWHHFYTLAFSIFLYQFMGIFCIYLLDG